MRRLLWIAPFLLGSACATPVAQPVASADPGRVPVLAAPPAPAGEPQPVSTIPPEPNTISTRRTFVCRAFVRPSVYVKPEPLEEIRMSEPGDRSVSSGAFRFRVLYDDGPYEGRTLITYVYSTSTGKLIEESLFQLDRQKGPVNQFNGGHGFSGLHYVYAPDSAAELQYWCSAGDAPAGG